MPAGHDTTTLNAFIKHIDEGKVVLPNFQRDFVWKIDDQKEMLASFLVELPVGSLLVLEGERGEFASRKLCFRGAPEKEKEECKYLLDGQQRISSLSNIFRNNFGTRMEWIDRWDSIFPLLRVRWCIRLEPKEEESDIFKSRTLQYKSVELHSFEPADIKEFIVPLPIHKTKNLDKWYHPAVKPIDEVSGDPLTGAQKNEWIARQAANEGLMPLWEVYSNPDSGIHWNVLGKISNDIADKLKAKVQDGVCTHKEILEKIDIDIEKKISENDFEGINNIWNQLKVHWQTQVNESFKKILSQTIPQIVLPSEEISRAIACFSAINEGGTHLDPFDLIVARAARQKDLKSLTERIINEAKKEIRMPDSLVRHIKGKGLTSWDLKKFDVIKEGVVSPVFKNMYLNLLSLLVFCDNEKEIPKVDHIKSKYHLKLTHDQINKFNEKCVNALVRAFSFLNIRCGVTNINEISYKLMTIPLAYALSDDDRYEDTVLLDLLEYWYWVSLFSGRYRLYPNDTCIKDISTFTSGLEKSVSTFDVDKDKVLNVEDYSNIAVLSGENSIGFSKSIHRTILQYVLSTQPRDFVYDTTLNSWEIGIEKVIKHKGKSMKLQIILNDHHIIPLSGASSIGETTSKLRDDKTHILNSPLNRTYILQKTNNEIGPKNINEYIEYVYEASSWNHCIPNKAILKKLSGEDNGDYYKRITEHRYEEIKKTLLEELLSLKNSAICDKQHKP